MPDLRDRIRRDENAFQRLLEAIPGFDGYREREIRRTADKLLREHLVAQMDGARADLNKVVGRWARDGRLDHLEGIDRLSRLMAKARDNIRFADYGHTGFFDAVKIKEDELDRLYDYDLSLREKIELCARGIEALSAAGDDPSEQMAGLESAIDELQDMIDRREAVASSLVPDDA